MSKQRYIRDEIWDDTWFYELTPDEKITWLYLLTNPRCNIAGIYKLNRATSWAALGLANEGVLNTVLGGFEKAGKLILFEDWIVITNFLKHQNINPSVKQGIARVIADLPQALTACIQAGGRLGTACPTLLNSTLLNFTLLNGNGVFPDEVLDDTKYTEKDMQMVELLISLIIRNNPDWQMRGKKEVWAEYIEKMHRIDKRTYQQIEYMIRWTQNDSFWQQNILSTAKLREKFNDLIPKVRASAAKAQQSNKPKML